MKSKDSLLSNFYHEGSWIDEGSNIFIWNLSVKQDYVNVAELVEEIIELEFLPDEKLALYIHTAAIGATTKIGAEDAVQWLANLKRWATTKL
ncbi:hypothetical protein [Teredinibacter turnerae]|uniref:hypothetical protein n=1 Tax=Teredinibacter turnerae TaxID=2426 RepID=UPI0005A0EAF4|nr:hypothetical protein [Teredinibacter turnerae]